MNAYESLFTLYLLPAAAVEMNDNRRANNQLKSIILKDAPLGFDELTELSGNPTLLIDTGYEYVELGKYEEAFNLFSVGASRDNTDPDILNGLGITLCELGKLEESRRILMRAARYNPDDPVTFANLAGVCWEIGEYECAIYYYNRSLELNTEIEEIHFNLINLYIEAGSLYMAFIACLNFQEIFPGNEEAEELLQDIILNMGLSFY